MLRALQNNDGLTLKNGKPIQYKSGWQVADYGEETRDINEAEKLIAKFNGNCGVWFADGIYYIDHSFRVDTKKEALRIGKEHNQISIWGWRSQKLAYCNEQARKAPFLQFQFHFDFQMLYIQNTYRPQNQPYPA